MYIDGEANESRIPKRFFFSLISMKYITNISIQLKLYVIEQKPKRNDIWIEIKQLVNEYKREKKKTKRKSHVLKPESKLIII